MSTIAFIPARGGSKSIPLKNVKPINGRPLIYWTLDAAAGCLGIDKVVVSTDSGEIRKCVEAYGSDKIVVVARSGETATDSASTESVMLEYAAEHEFGSMILIQATSPLLRSADLERAIWKWNETKADSLLSVVRQKRFLWREEGSFAVPQNYDYMNRPRRQEFEGYLVENGAFYILRRENLLKNGNRLFGKITYYEMDEESYYEIDEQDDWDIVEMLLKKRNGVPFERLKDIQMLLTDNDGVMTDNGMYYTENGDEMKRYNAKDGMAFRLLREKGILTGIITGETRECVARRAQKLGVDELHMGIMNKMEIIDAICGKYKITYKNIAYIGDDINDTQVIQSVGFGCSVADGMQEVQDAAVYVTKAKGGGGAVREIAELIIRGVC